MPQHHVMSRFRAKPYLAFERAFSTLALTAETNITPTHGERQCTMPPPILNDSEDDEDDVVYDDAKGNSLSRSSGEAEAAIPALDGTRDMNNQSTGSTGKDFRTGSRKPTH